MGTSGKIALVLCALLAAAVDAGLVRPAAFERAERDVAALQQRAAAGLSCRIATHEALGTPDAEVLALLQRHCAPR